MILRIKIKKKFRTKDFENIAKINKKEHQKIVNKESQFLGRRTRDKVRENISASIKRPNSTKNLQSSFKYHSFGGLGWGVGQVNYLKRKAPYYLAINYGSRHMVGKRVPRGRFFPGKQSPSRGQFRRGRWYRGGKYSFIVRRPIKATYYIEKTNHWLGRQTSRFIARINNQFRRRYKK